MESLFTSTTVLLTSEYIQLHSTSDLLSKLSKVSSATGIRYSKAKDTFALSGTWEQVNKAFEILQHWLQITNNESGETSSAHSQFTDTDGYVDIESKVKTTVPTGQESLTKCSKLKTSKDVTKKLVTSKEHICSLSSDGQCDGQLHEDGGDGHAILVPESNMDEKKKGNPSVQRQKRKIVHEQSLSKEKKLKPNFKSNANPQKNETITVDSASSSGCKRLNLRQTKKIKTQSKTSCTENETKRTRERKEQKSDKENQLNRTNISNVEERTSIDVNDSSKQKLTKKPGEKGYWSRVKIANYNEKHTCAKCGVTLKSRKRYMEHMRRIHIKEFQCDVCFRRFGYPTDLHRHKCPGIPDPENKCKAKGGRPKKEKSTVQVSLPCEECDYVGTSQKRLNGHIKRTHRLTQACDICDKKFGFIRDLERHKLSVHTDTSYFCDRCSKCYKSRAVFEMHLKTHEEGYIKPKFACEICGKLFTTKYGLKAHNKMEHLGMKREYLCQVCGKKFRQRNSYKQHMNAHNGVKPYVCGICGKGFTYHKSLKEHKYMHDNIRRFQCNLCEKAFRQRTTLQIHMKVHKTIKDYTCSRCGKGFSQKQALERHERIHTGIKPYTCVPCQRSFGDASTIRRHMKAIHQKTEYNWREDIICNLKRKTDYYVLGGTGQNRTYKSKCKSSDSTANSIDTLPHQSKGSNISPIETSSTPEHTVISIPQTEVPVNQSEYKAAYTYTELNSLHNSTDPHSNLLTSGVYGIATPQLSQNSLNINYTNGSIQVDFTSLSQPAAQINPPVNKVGIVQDNSSQLQQQGPDLDLQNTNLSASLVEGADVNENQRIDNQSNTNPLNNSETNLNQTLASLWGIIGYSNYYSTNLAQYQGSQNP